MVVSCLSWGKKDGTSYRSSAESPWKEFQKCTFLLRWRTKSWIQWWEGAVPWCWRGMVCWFLWGEIPRTEVVYYFNWIRKVHELHDNKCREGLGECLMMLRKAMNKQPRVLHHIAVVLKALKLFPGKRQRNWWESLKYLGTGSISQSQITFGQKEKLKHMLLRAGIEPGDLSLAKAWNKDKAWTVMQPVETIFLILPLNMDNWVQFAASFLLKNESTHLGWYTWTRILCNVILPNLAVLGRN